MKYSTQYAMRSAQCAVGSAQFLVKQFLSFGVILMVFSGLAGCGDTQVTEKTDSLSVIHYDSFKEGVKKLHRNGFLQKFAASDLDSLIEVYRKDSVNGMKQMLIDAGDMLGIDIGLNGRAPHEVYQSISNTIGAKYPDLQATEIKHRYLPEFPGGKDTGWVLLSQKFGKQWYTRKLYFFEDWPVDNFVYRMYNTMMADSGKDTRFYLTQFFLQQPDTGFYDDFMHDLDVTRMGLLRLTKQQADTILSIPELDVEPEEEFNVYTTQKIEEEIAKFKTTGLITPENQKWYDTVCTDIRANSLYKQEDFLDFVDVFFARLMFDTLNIYNPYEEILMSMADASRGAFEPSGMNDEAIGQSNMHTVRFTLKGKVYEREFATQNGIVSPYIFDMVNEALAEQKMGGAFYSVLTRDDVVLAIYLKDSEVDKVIRSGFFTTLEKGAPSELQIIYGAAPKAF